MSGKYSDRLIADVYDDCHLLPPAYGEDALAWLVAQTDSPIERQLGAAIWAAATHEPFAVLPSRMWDHSKIAEPASTTSGKLVSEWTLQTSPPSWVVCPQVIVGKHRVDFLIFSSRWNSGRVEFTEVAIECDGRDFHDKHQWQADRDRKRDRALSGEGLHVLRFSGSEIFNDADACVREIREWVDSALERSGWMDIGGSAP